MSKTVNVTIVGLVRAMRSADDTSASRGVSLAKHHNLLNQAMMILAISALGRTAELALPNGETLVITVKS